MDEDAEGRAVQGAPAEEPLVITAFGAGDERGDVGRAPISAQGSHAVLVARFADRNAAARVHDGLRNGEGAGRYHIDGVLVVHADDQGRVNVQQMTDHHTRTGAGWGIVGGVIAGILFPPSIVASAAVLGGAGAILGKIGNIREKHRVEKAVADVITADTSGILALVSLDDVEAITAAIPEAQEIRTIPVDDATATAIEQAAASADAKVSPEGAGRPPASPSDGWRSGAGRRWGGVARRRPDRRPTSTWCGSRAVRSGWAQTRGTRRNARSTP